MRRFGLVTGVVAMALAVGVGACGGDDRRGDEGDAPRGASATAAPAPHVARGSSQVGDARFAMTVHWVDTSDAAFFQRLRDGSTVNVDGKGLRPSAGDALPTADAAASAPRTDGAQGVVVAASEEGASYSVDGFPLEKIPGDAFRGWWLAARKLGPGVHSLSVRKDGCFPADTQVLVQPGVYEVVAVRLGKVVMRSGGMGAGK